MRRQRLNDVIVVVFLLLAGAVIGWWVSTWTLEWLTR